METFGRLVSGRHTPAEIRWHLAVLAIGYWGLVCCAWRGYPAEHHYSAFTKTLSALGSFDDKHNPEWFWLFSVAMVYCGIMMIPVMSYIRRKFSAVSKRGAQIGFFLFLIGCIAIILTGLFPDSHGRVVGTWQWQHIHRNTAGAIAFAFSLGVIWHGILLFVDMITQGTFSESGALPYWKLFGPFSVCIPVLAAAFYKIQWGAFFSALRALGAGSGQQVGEYLKTSVAGFHSFPILEHMAIWGLTLFVIWFAGVLSFTSASECNAA